MIFRNVSELPEVIEVDLEIASDNRGEFSRVYCSNEFSNYGLPFVPAQINVSRNTHKGTFRGLHYQKAPFQELKVVTCLQGSLVDILLDLRKDSPTFLKYVKIPLDETTAKSIIIPPGVAHGFQTTKAETTLLYLHSTFYSAPHQGGVRFKDPRIQLSLPLPVSEISERDKNLPLLKNSFTGLEV